MKKSLLALAVLGAFASAASAQSSVKLSGGVDLGVIRNGPAKTWTMGTSGSSSSNFALTVVEDLGGGMNVTAYMNHRFNPNNGTISPGGANPALATPQFWRNSWIQLGGAFGAVRMGRYLNPLQEYNGGYEPWGGGDTVGNVHTGGTVVPARYNNQIEYRSPSFGGLSGLASIAAGEDQVAAGNSSKRPVGFGLKYDAGPLSAAFAYDKNPLGFKTLGLYGKYNFGVATPMFQYERAEITSSLDDNRFSISADVPFGAFTGKVGVLRIKRDLAGGGSASQTKLGLGLWYAMSKRTSLYTDMGKPSGDNLATGVGLTSDEKKASFDVGIRHSF
jgi:predicted porin